MKRLAGITALFAIGLLGCNPDPGEIEESVGYRDGSNDTTNSGERGTIKITEINWAGSVTNEGEWDPKDVFVEIRNEGVRPMNLGGWRIVMQGVQNITWRIPEMTTPIPVGGHIFIAAKNTGCFPEPDLILEGMYFGNGGAFRLTIQDKDERLIEPAGSRHMPPFAGIYDGQVVRSMEKIELMFGGRGNESNSWHHYTEATVDVPNNDRVAEGCRVRTLASPGRPNSPDYSGAFSAGSLE